MRKTLLAIVGAATALTLAGCGADTPTPAPTVTVTATPAPAPTVTVTATPTPTPKPAKTTDPTETGDGAFLERMVIEEPSMVASKQDKLNVLTLGKGVCDRLDSGAEIGELVDTIETQGADKGWTHHSAISVVTASVVYLCPEHNP